MKLTTKHETAPDVTKEGDMPCPWMTMTDNRAPEMSNRCRNGRMLTRRAMRQIGSSKKTHSSALGANTDPKQKRPSVAAIKKAVRTKHNRKEEAEVQPQTVKVRCGFLMSRMRFRMWLRKERPNAQKGGKTEGQKNRETAREERGGMERRGRRKEREDGMEGAAEGGSVEVKH